MSLYNMINGMNNNAIILLSLLLNMRVDKYFPRFRDVFTEAEGYPDGDFYVYTRMGGGNRDCWKKDEHMEICDCPACISYRIEHEPWCVARIDDSFDSTYCMFVIKFSDPELRDTLDKLRQGVSLVASIPDVGARFTTLFPREEARPE